MCVIITLHFLGFCTGYRVLHFLSRIRRSVNEAGRSKSELDLQISWALNSIRLWIEWTRDRIFFVCGVAGDRGRQVYCFILFLFYNYKKWKELDKLACASSRRGGGSGEMPLLLYGFWNLFLCYLFFPIMNKKKYLWSELK